MKKIFALLILSCFLISGLASFADNNSGKYPLAVKHQKPPKSHFRPIYRPYHRPYYRNFNTGCSSIYISNKNGYTIKQYNCFEPYYISPGVTYINFSM